MTGSSRDIELNCQGKDTVNGRERNKKVWEFIEDVTANADEVQRRVLDDILRDNAQVEYLQRHGLNGQTARMTFKRLIPVITYEDIFPDIQRIVNGDTSHILCTSPISEFIVSTGTTGSGESKLIPTTSKEIRKRAMYNFTTPIIDKFVPGLDKGKAVYFHFPKPEEPTPGGIPARFLLTSMYKCSYFRDMPYDPYNDYTCPSNVILCPDMYQSMYCQMLCGLYHSTQVIRCGAIFASGFIRVLKFLEKTWEVLCNDIRTGTLNPLVTDLEVRESVMNILRPNPSLAKFTENECRKGSWKGIITRLWPNTKFIDLIVTGTMSQYIPILDYYSNGLPLVTMAYASSECLFGLNLNPLCKPSEISYTMLPNMAYFEFLPVNKSRESSNDHSDDDASCGAERMEELVDLVDVKLGEEYEVVVTTYAGLYRYRVGDILRVTGFKNKAPQFRFVSRKNVVISIDFEKTSEVVLHNAVVNAAAHLQQFDISLVDYTCFADTSGVPGHYVLFWEIKRNGATPFPPSTLKECCLTIEESLDTIYRQGRSDKSIGPLEIRVVENGTFDKLMDYMITQLGASISQYKMPRCVKHASLIELLNSAVLSAYFSPRCPKLTPGIRNGHQA